MPEIAKRYARVLTRTFYGQRIHVHVDTETGNFIVYDDDGNRLKSGTDWEQTIWKARGMLRRTLANVEIPFRTKDGRTGKALNIHSGTGNVTIQFPGSRKVQIDQHDARRLYFKSETTDEQIAEMARLERLINERSRQLRALKEEIEIDLHEAVTVAVDAQIKATEEASWGTTEDGRVAMDSIAETAIPESADDDEEEEEAF